MAGDLPELLNRRKARVLGWREAFRHGSEQWWLENRPRRGEGAGRGSPPWDDFLLSRENGLALLEQMARSWAALREWPPAADGFLSLYDLLELAADQAGPPPSVWP